MQADAMTLYKLIILYILDKVDFPMTNAQISNFILEKEYTSYFNIQQAFNALSDAELIHMDTIRNSSYFKLTKAGHETIGFFRTDISQTIRDEIDHYLIDNQYELRQEVSTLSDYYQTKPGEYIAHCLVKERESTIIELNLNVTSEQEAEAVCNQWKEASQEIYQFVMSKLM
ncbi:MAG: DUF4364 family protein [Lachnospiraceae bacterium]|nr:DUF4364 family protein [Lachnospiraceae bacterium]